MHSIHHILLHLFVPTHAKHHHTIFAPTPQLILISISIQTPPYTLRPTLHILNLQACPIPNPLRAADGPSVDGYYNMVMLTRKSGWKFVDASDAAILMRSEDSLILLSGGRNHYIKENNRSV